MPHANWYSEPDRDMPSFGSFDPSMIADDDTRFVLERIREELAQLGRGCEKPLYGLRAHCWMPDVGRVKYGYYMAEFNETVLSAPESGKRVVVLPDAVLRPGGSVEVIDRMGNAGTINITIKTIKGQTINRAATYTVSTNSAGVVFRSDGENWWAISSSPGGSTGSGDVVGPASSTDNTYARWDGTTGKLLQNGTVTEDDDGDVDNVKSLDIGVAAGSGEDGKITVAGADYTSPLMVHDIGTGFTATCNLHKHSTSAGGVLAFSRSHSATSSHTVVSDDDQLGTIAFLGHDGTDYAAGAYIIASVDGAPGSNDMPTRLEFYVTPDGSQTPGLALTITQDKAMTLAGSLQTQSGRVRAVHVTSGNLQLDGTHHVIVVTGAHTLTLPADLSTSDGFSYVIINRHSAAITVARNGNTINGVAADYSVPAGTRAEIDSPGGTVGTWLAHGASEGVGSNVTAASAFGTDEAVIVADGTGRGAKATPVIIDSATGNTSGMGTLGCGAINSSGAISREGLIDDKGQARVYRSGSDFDIGVATWTKVAFNSETFDTNSYFDSATNFRYTPTKAGKYTVRSRLLFGAEFATGDCNVAVYKNGSAVAYGMAGVNETNAVAAMVFDEVDMNGSTDYLEIWAYSASGADVLRDSVESYASFERVD